MVSLWHQGFVKKNRVCPVVVSIGKWNRNTIVGNKRSDWNASMSRHLCNRVTKMIGLFSIISLDLKILLHLVIISLDLYSTHQLCLVPWNGPTEIGCELKAALLQLQPSSHLLNFPLLVDWYTTFVKLIWSLLGLSVLYPSAKPREWWIQCSDS